MTDLVEVTVKLGKLYGLRVQNLDMRSHLVHEFCLPKLGKSCGKYFHDRCLTREWSSDNHQTMSHQNHFIKLDDFINEVVVVGKIHLVHLVGNSFK